MAKKKVETVNPKWNAEVLREALGKLEGVNEEIVNHAVEYGVPDDAYAVQAFYRVSDTTAREIIKAFKEAKND